MRALFWPLALLPLLLACQSKGRTQLDDVGANPDSGAADSGPDEAPLPDFVVVAGSTFDMGCTSGQTNCYEDEQVHSVTLTQDVSVGTTEVNQAQFQALMGYDPSSFSACGGTCPVEGLSWHEAVGYANARSASEGLESCYSCSGGGTSLVCAPAMSPYDCDGYRLLTEAEWEGAARCGTDLQYAGSNDAAEVAWTSDNSKSATHAAASLDANACGLYDLSGNVWEWTHDWYDSHGARGDDPAGPDSGEFRVIRGGCWYYQPSAARVANRNYASPEEHSIRLGFRIARTVLAR